MNKKYFIVLILFCFNKAFAGNTYTEALKKHNLLQIDYNTCEKIENQLGQLFYVNVDGFGENVNESIHPLYIKMVHNLNIGGVLPHFGSINDDYRQMRNSVYKLKKASVLPLFVGVDYINGKLNKYKTRFSYLGLGYGSGFMNSVNKLPQKCASRRSYLHAIIHKAIGINHALGPTVDISKQWDYCHCGGNGSEQDEARRHFLDGDVKSNDSTWCGLEKNEIINIAKTAKAIINQYDNLGVLTTLKHFPYTPDDYNLHRFIKDTMVSQEEVIRRLRIFKLLSDDSSFMMTTHLLNSNVDDQDVATFSTNWIDLLRNWVGFSGLLMTDAIYMLRDEVESKIIEKMYSKWVSKESFNITDKYSVFAARSLLAGHDIVFLESKLKDTVNVFKNLHYISCQNTQNGENLRNVIFGSYKRIFNFKKYYARVLEQNINIPEGLLFLIINLDRAYRKSKTCDEPVLETSFIRIKNIIDRYNVYEVRK